MIPREQRWNVTSQDGEDSILAELFRRLGVTRGTIVEVGAHDGKTNSNTYNLIMNYGWSGTLIEADAGRHAQLAELYKDRLDVVTKQHLVGFDVPDTIDNVADTSDVDLLAIDIDGNDYHVWAAAKLQAKVVVIEFNPSFPNHILFVQARDMRCSQGSSLRALTELARTRDYVLVATTSCNAFYVKRGLYPRTGLSDNSLTALHSDTRFQTHVLQLYDGTLLIGGFASLIWHPDRVVKLIQESPLEQFKPFICRRVEGE